MKVLLYSHSFYPSIGGLETVSLTLAEGFFQNSINLKIITATAENGEREFPFEVIRNPVRKQQIALIKWSDVILFNGASLALQPWILLFRKPFIWIHTGYQVSCIDGAGWLEGKRAPIEPFSSIIYHSKVLGWRWGLKKGVKLLIRRCVAKYFVAHNIAITEWMYKMQQLPRQIQIYNPFPIDKFILSDSGEPEYDFLYLGRLVSEKGVATLLQAFSKVLFHTNLPLRLLIIGDGDYRQKLEYLSNDLHITKAVTFVGNKVDKELVEWVSKGRIAVVPSEWCESMGGVALELMASGKNLIVSELGGLRECVGDAGLSFPNGNDEALAECMIRLLEDASLRKEQLAKGKERVKSFAPSFFVTRYIDLLKKVAGLN